MNNSQAASNFVLVQEIAIKQGEWKINISECRYKEYFDKILYFLHLLQSTSKQVTTPVRYKSINTEP
jgi:hypothetical protein